MLSNRTAEHQCKKNLVGHGLNLLIRLDSVLERDTITFFQLLQVEFPPFKA